jgi:2-hydroxychromene-2-carboxylate isomerase
VRASDSIDFWYSIGSTYSYLTIARLDDVAKREGVSFRWRPFYVRTIMMEQNNIPFSTKPIKAKYMWRDLERRAQGYGIPIRLPVTYPPPEMELANRVAVLGEREGWGPDYARETYRRWFVEGESPGGDANMAGTLKAIGQDPARVVAAAKADDIAGVLAGATDEARRQNVFGVPTFVTRGEIFWGDDRLGDAIEWHRQGSLAGDAGRRGVVARIFGR